MVLSTPAMLKQVLEERVKVDITDSDLAPNTSGGSSSDSNRDESS